MAKHKRKKNELCKLSTFNFVLLLSKHNFHFLIASLSFIFNSILHCILLTLLHKYSITTIPVGQWWLQFRKEGSMNIIAWQMVIVIKELKNKILNEK